MSLVVAGLLPDAACLPRSESYNGTAITQAPI
jgi:hypothetical protein